MLNNVEVIFFDLGETIITKDGQWVVGAKSIIHRFSNANIRTGVISNTGSLTRGELSEFLPDDFDWVMFEESLIILSGEVNIEKPDPEIFTLAVEKANISAEKCLFCTEEFHHSLVAQHLGFKIARIERSQEKDLVSLANFILTKNP